MFTADGTGVLYDFGNWSWEGTTLKGGSLPWLAPASVGVPTFFPTVSSCSVVHPSVSLATGDVLFVHGVCVSTDDEGLFLYPSAGGTSPKKLVASAFGAGQVQPSLETASWVADGSGFVFVGTIDVVRNGTTERASSLLFYDMATATVSSLVIPESNTRVEAATISPDATAIVHCLSHDAARDLHAIDVAQTPPEDKPITTDGKSCYPAF
jgi:hypothetical protein